MGQWKKVWGYVPVDWGTVIGTAENITQKIHIRNNLNGTAIKIKFYNLYDEDALLLEQVRVGKYDRKGGQIGEIREVTCQGARRIEVLPGNTLYSDEIPFDLKDTDDLAVTIYFKEKHDFHGTCQTWNAESWQSSFNWGNQAENLQMDGISAIEMFPFFAEDENSCNAVFGISGLQVLTEAAVTSVACFGDSITHMSYYFDPLQDVLYHEYPGEITCFNCGIGGNRVLYDACYVEDIPGYGKCFGRAGLERFEEDVYGDTNPDIIFLMEGVNDCTHGLAFQREYEVPSAEMLFEGIRTMVEKAHARGSRVYISTVMPFGCYGEPFRERAEVIRQEVNGLIRQHQDIADGFVDLDEIVRSPEDIHFMKDGFHLGDGVHPSRKGGKVIADAVAGLFRTEK